MGAATWEAKAALCEQKGTVPAKLFARYLFIDLLKALLKHQICFLPVGFSLTIFLLISSLVILRDYTLILIKLQVEE